jgi:hypothetical protein
MIDPAVAAAQRVWTIFYGKELDRDNPIASSLIVGAREVLKPIRELHKPYFDDGDLAPGRGWVCPHDWDNWPCATAKLIYSADELKP